MAACAQKASPACAEEPGERICWIFLMLQDRKVNLTIAHLTIAE